jgi:acetyltransferase-like isoleucine patch superfamily enzyme
VRIFYPRCLTVGDDITIEGPGYLHCLSEEGVRIGSHSSFGPNLWLHCGATSTDSVSGYFCIGENSFIGCNAVIGAGGGILIGDDVLIAPNATLISEEHRFSQIGILIREQGVSRREITIGDNVWIGAGVKILAGVTIGNGVVIGAGAVVTRNVPPESVAVGVPAKVIRSRG